MTSDMSGTPPPASSMTWTTVAVVFSPARSTNAEMARAHPLRLSQATIGLEILNELADVDVVPNAARRQPHEILLSNAFGFGGTNCCIVFKGVS